MIERVTILLTLIMSATAQAEFSRDFIDSHTVEKAVVGDVSIAYRVIGEGANRPKAVAIMGLGERRLGR